MCLQAARGSCLHSRMEPLSLQALSMSWLSADFRRVFLFCFIREISRPGQAETGGSWLLLLIVTVLEKLESGEDWHLHSGVQI